MPDITREEFLRGLRLSRDADNTVSLYGPDGDHVIYVVGNLGLDLSAYQIGSWVAAACHEYAARRREQTHSAEYVTEEEAWAHTPDYGTTWASCEEIDAACKERGWRAQIDMDGDETRVFLFTTINGLIGTRLSAAYAPTFPAAFAEAFCEAVETNGE